MQGLLSIILNILDLLIITKASIKNNEKNNGWINIYSLYCYCMLFYIIVPLLFDSVYAFIYTSEKLKSTLMLTNDSALIDFYALSEGSIWEISVYAFIFNLILSINYKILLKSKIKNVSTNYDEREIILVKPWIYWLCAWLGLILWGLRFGIDFAHAGIGYRNINDNRNTALAIIASILFSCSLPGLCQQFSGRILNAIIIGIPFFIIGILTTSKALFINYFCVLFMFIAKETSRIAGKKLIKRIVKVIFYIVVVECIISVCIAFRTDKFNLYIFPIWRDTSYFDMHYCFYKKDLMYNSGQSILRMVTTNPIYKFKLDKNFEDIPNKLANIRFHYGWGTLHPTIIGWCYADYGWASLLLHAFFFGWVIAISERIRLWMRPPVDMMYIGCQFTFICVLLRGSCQYAYVELLYPTVAFVIINIVVSKMGLKPYIYHKT